MDRSASLFPTKLRDETTGEVRENISRSLGEYLAQRNIPPECVFQHVLAIVHAPSYRIENSDELQLDWPRVLFPSNDSTLCASARLGAGLNSLLDPEIPVPGVSNGQLHPGLRMLGVPRKRGGGSLRDVDLKLIAGWGAIQVAGGGNQIVMPGRGLVVERDYAPGELSALEEEAIRCQVKTSDILTRLHNPEILTKGLVNAGDHVPHDFIGRIPNPQFFAQLRIEGFKKGFVKELNRIGLVKASKELHYIHAIQCGARPVKQLDKLQWREMSGTCELLVECPDKWDL
jgi:Type ISP C-terminal specificity domain